MSHLAIPDRGGAGAGRGRGDDDGGRAIGLDEGLERAVVRVATQTEAGVKVMFIGSGASAAIGRLLPMLSPGLGGLDGPSVIWLVCHYPDQEEAEERVRLASALHRALALPIWLFGSPSAQYPESVERLLKDKVVSQGVPPEAVICSAELDASLVSLDTAQEARNVSAAARRAGISTLVCVSNRLQLLQVRGLMRKEGLRLIMAPVPLRDRRWWYVTARLILIPLAFAGAGAGFWPLVLLRKARATRSRWRL